MNSNNTSMVASISWVNFELGSFLDHSQQLCMFLQVIGWENIELISDRPLETMLDEFKRLKAEYPGRHAQYSTSHTRPCCSD